MSTNIQVPPTGKRPSPVKQLRNSLTRNSGIVVIAVLVFLLVVSALGTLFALARQNTPNPNVPNTSAAKIVGHVYFLSSGRLYVNNNQGISDEVLIDLHNIPTLAPGKSYYGWLLGDKNQTDVPWVSLGALSVDRGNVHFLYPGDQAHTNLLTDMSRFLITEGDANTTPSDPLLDQSSWRYYAEIFQTPSPKDPNHFTLLDHLRHLLVQAPEINALGLPGGLSIWLLRNVQEISKWALAARDRWEAKDAPFIRQQLINILYYLDGECTPADLQGVPPGTLTTPQNSIIAHIAHFAILNPCVQEEQEQSETLKQVFHHVPHNYVDHLLFHMAGVTLSPGATATSRKLALQINTAINNVRNWLGQLHQDALQLVDMTDEQVVQLSSLPILDDLELQTRYAYAGRTDPGTGELQNGAAWIFDNVERLATIDVTPYSPA